MTPREPDVVSRLRREMQSGLLPRLLAWRDKLADSRCGRLARRAFAGVAAVAAQTPVLCPHCCRSIHRDTFGREERVFWCSDCEKVQPVPLFRIPGWVAGVLLILVFNYTKLR